MSFVVFNVFLIYDLTAGRQAGNLRLHFGFTIYEVRFILENLKSKIDNTSGNPKS